MDEHQSSPGEWEPPLPDELAPYLPDYEVVGVLGRGAMGAVYKAVQRTLQRPVALKLLPPELGSNAEFENRFRMEAKSMAQLNHPNIVQIFDFGQTSAGHFYIAMEYVEGEDLTYFIKNRALDVDGALNAVSQICQALDYAHAKGFVHRDIKPANIFLSVDGIIKVGDFGLAKMLDMDAGDGADSAAKMALTLTGVAVGTPLYMAPEQMEGGEVDNRSDIYSLGVMFYQMLTGELPRGMIVDPSKKIPQLDVRIDDVIFRAMDPDPSDRFQSAAGILTELDAIRSTPLQGAKEPEKSQSVPVSSFSEFGKKASSTTRLTRRPPTSGAGVTSKPKKGKLSVLLLSLISVLLIGGGFLVLSNSKKAQSTEPTENASQVQNDATNPGVQGKTPEPILRPPVEDAGTPPVTEPTGSQIFVTPHNSSRGGRDLATTQAPDKATSSRVFTNSLGMRFTPVRIAGGPSDNHFVLFSIWETRIQDYEVFASATDRRVDSLPYETGPEHPVARVSWEEAVAFCDWLTTREHEQGTLDVSFMYTLPYDHEWSCAAGMSALEVATLAPQTKNSLYVDTFYWGTTPTPPTGLGNLYGLDEPLIEGRPPLENYRDGYATPTPVGMFSPSNSNLFDLVGNLWEWVSESSSNDPVRRIMRGACYDNSMFNGDLHLSARVWRKATDKFHYAGFRPVLRLKDEYETIPVSSAALAFRLDQKSGFPVRLPARLETGKESLITMDAAILGIDPDKASEDQSDIIEACLAELANLQKERISIVSGIRETEKNRSLSRQFLNAVFYRKAMDPETGEFIPGYDKSFFQERAAANDTASIEDWRLLRDLLEAGELLEINFRLLKARPTKRPGKFDLNCFTYQTEVEARLEPLREFDRKLPGHIKAIQANYAARLAESGAAEMASTMEGMDFGVQVSMRLRDSVNSVEFPKPSSGKAAGDLEIQSSVSPVTPGSEPADESPDLEPDSNSLPPQPVTNFTGTLPPSLPSLPKKECRIVIIEPEKKETKWANGAYEAIEQEDNTSLVKFGERMTQKSVVAIQSDGTPVTWRFDGEVIKPRSNPGAVLAFYVEECVRLGWVGSDGRMGSISPNHTHVERDLGTVSDAVYVRTMQEVIHVIEKNGKRHTTGGWRMNDESTQRVLKERDTIARYSQDEPWSFRVLRTDGSIDFFKGKEVINTHPPGSAIDIIGPGMALNPNGKYFGIGPMAKFPDFDKIDELTHFRGRAPYFAMRWKGNQRWAIWNRKEAWRREPELEQIFAQAEDLYFWNGYIYALFPAEMLPRSGIWNLEALRDVVSGL